MAFNIDMAAVARREQQARDRVAALLRKHRIPSRDVTALMHRHELESDEFRTAEEKAIALWIEQRTHRP